MLGSVTFLGWLSTGCDGSIPTHTAVSTQTASAQAGPVPAAAAPVRKDSRGIVSRPGDPAARRYAPGELVMKLRPEASIAMKASNAMAGFLRQHSRIRSVAALKMGRHEPGSIYRVAVDASDQAQLLREAAELQQDERVEWAEPNQIFHTSAAPADPFYDQQMFHSWIGSETAWNTTTGSPTVVVGVIDTGIDWQHPDLAANIWRNTREVDGDGVDNDGNGYIDDVRGWDFVSASSTEVATEEDGAPPDNNPTDVLGHGTHVAGIIGAVGNNNVGVTGVAWRASLMPLRAGYKTADGQGNLRESDVAAALAYAADNGAHIVNMSFGSTVPSHTMLFAIEYAVQRGVVLVAAAGNDAKLVAAYPAAYNNVISVAALSDAVTPAPFSNFGTWVDLAAPGVDIMNTVPGGAYERMSGTSMASPVVAGVAALVRAAHPTWTRDQIERQLVATTSALALGAGPYSGKLGSGRVSSAAAVGALATAPGLLVTDTFVDEAQGDKDGEYEAGEVLNLYATVRSVGGSDVAANTVLTLTSSDARLQIVQGVANLGPIPFGRGVTNSGNPLKVQIPTGIPANTVVDMRITASTPGATARTATIPVTLSPAFRRAQLVDNFYPIEEGVRGYQLHQLPNGKLLYVGSRQGPTTQGVFATVREANGRWLNPVQISNPAGNAANADSFLASDGNLHVVYERNVGPWQAQVFYARYNTATNALSAEEQVSIGSTIGELERVGTTIQVLVDSSGRRHVAWVDRRNGGAPQLWLSSNGGTGWSAEASIASLANITSAQLDMFQTSSTQRVLFLTSGGPDGEVSRAYHGTGTTTWDAGRTVATFFDSGVPFQPKGGTNASSPHKLVKVTQSSDLQLARYDGSNWQVVQTVMPNPVGNYWGFADLISGMIDSAGLLNLARVPLPQDGSPPYTLAYLRGTPGGTLSVTPVPRAPSPSLRGPVVTRVNDQVHIVASHMVASSGGWSVVEDAEYYTTAPVDPTLVPTTPVVAITSANPTTAPGRISFQITSSHPSGFVYHEYAIGTSPGGSDVRDWVRVPTSASTITQFVDLDSTPMVPGQPYFVSARSRSAAVYTSLVGVSAPVLAVAAAEPVASTSVPPVIDGQIDSSWSRGTLSPIGKVLRGGPVTSADLSGSWRAVWDAEYLYLLVEVSDEAASADSSNVWDDDSIELYLDGDNARGAAYDANDHQVVFRRNDSRVYVGARSAPASPGVRFSFSDVTNGYRLEAAIPWSSLGGVVAPGRRFGLDVHVNDDDNGGARDAKIAWSASTDEAWQDPRLFREMTLSGPTPPPFAASIAPASGLPLLDGNADDQFGRSATRSIAKPIRNSLPAASDLNATWRALHDSVYLYLFIDVTDEAILSDSAGGLPWEDDSVEILIDGDGSAGPSYDGVNDVHLIFRPNDAQIRLGVNSAPVQLSQVGVVTRTVAGGYKMEIDIPWSAINTTGGRGKIFGLDVEINDDDNGAARDNKIAWWASADEAWQQPNLLGRTRLGEVSNQ